MNKAIFFKWYGSIQFAIMVGMLTCSITACNNDGLTAGDPNYFTDSRGQFTATITDNVGKETKLFLIPGATPGTAIVTYDGANPRHWQSETVATVRVGTYQDQLLIPEKVNIEEQTFTITGIDKEAFMGCREYVANGITYWNGLKSITLPETVTELGEGAFALTDLIEVNLPQSISKLPFGCFGSCTKLATIHVPGTITSIGEMAFYGCTSATDLTLDEGVEQIGKMAFFDCPKLTEVTLPSSVKVIGDKAFGGRDSRRSKIAIYHIKATTPPTLEGILYEADESITPIIYVPTGCAATYQAATGWNKLTIEEE